MGYFSHISSISIIIINLMARLYIPCLYRIIFHLKLTLISMCVTLYVKIAQFQNSVHIWLEYFVT